MWSDTAIQRAGEARAGLRRPRADRDRRAVQPVHGSGAGHAPRRSRRSAPTTYGVTFPLLAKTDVNGPDRHPLFAELTKTADADGEAGDVQWNFEKFLLAPGGDGGQAIPSAHRTRRPRGGRGHRGRPAAIARIDNCCKSVVNRCDTWRCDNGDVAGQLIVSISGISEQTLPDVAAFCAQLEDASGTDLVPRRATAEGRLPARPRPVDRGLAGRTAHPRRRHRSARLRRGRHQEAARRVRDAARTRGEPAADGRRPGARAPRAAHPAVRRAGLDGVAGNRRCAAAQRVPATRRAERHHRPGAQDDRSRTGARHRRGLPVRAVVVSHAGAVGRAHARAGQASCGSRWRRDTCASRDRARPCSMPSTWP